jgi:hypothetical protein
MYHPQGSAQTGALDLDKGLNLLLDSGSSHWMAVEYPAWLRMHGVRQAEDGLGLGSSSFALVPPTTFREFVHLQAYCAQCKDDRKALHTIRAVVFVKVKLALSKALGHKLRGVFNASVPDGLLNYLRNIVATMPNMCKAGVKTESERWEDMAHGSTSAKQPDCGEPGGGII